MHTDWHTHTNNMEVGRGLVEKSGLEDVWGRAIGNRYDQITSCTDMEYSKKQ